MKPNKSQGRKLDDGLWDIYGPIGRTYILAGVKYMRTGQTRDGLMFSGQDLQRYLTAYGWAVSTEQALMNILEQLKDNYDEAEKLWMTYKERLTAFRSEVKNDVVSLEAAARKTTEAVQRMNKAYSDVITQMNSQDMLQAISNAERLASAMTALSQLQSHRLVLSVADQSNGAG